MWTSVSRTARRDSLKDSTISFCSSSSCYFVFGELRSGGRLESRWSRKEKEDSFMVRVKISSVKSVYNNFFTIIRVNFSSIYAAIDQCQVPLADVSAPTVTDRIHRGCRLTSDETVPHGGMRWLHPSPPTPGPPPLGAGICSGADPFDDGRRMVQYYPQSQRLRPFQLRSRPRTVNQGRHVWRAVDSVQQTNNDPA